MARVGIVGGGQLGRMLCLAGYPLDIRCVTLDPGTDTPAAQVAPALVGAYDDRDRLAALADGADVITYEFENVPVDAMRWVGTLASVHPPADALEVAQDRLSEKQMFETVGLPVAPYVPVDSSTALLRALEVVGTPAVLKTRRLGYDGKGQAVIHDPVLAEDAWRAVGELPSILESFVAFDREVSVVAARGRDGDVACYPIVQNHHHDGILRLTLAPAPNADAALQARAEGHVRALMDRLAYVGVLALELFQVGEELLGNEMAPRVHNSGHWTIEGAETSQFEQHLRAVTGLPLGSVAQRCPSAMINVIGREPDPAAVTAIPGAHLHRYGKEPRPGRKLGHITVCAPAPEELAARVLQVSSLVDDAVPERLWRT